ncbi:MAG: glycosyltransferase family 9 protein [Sulfuricurvum sp.]|uniref:glycosyltransferase family 9 protein n=1 Tax=Sulfuricurvum sp. TaxID=2025608 RepID=UPI002609497A|nr:glycosyltransferase family 9 protein [Sulfuricurvum sp.]MDD2370287.1 glycosyltransferase family 9 protein [Sulfuricurvum sp.]MDD2950835.1 glycosyltransferase family 9 protein [Sulfuricurvum sp.]MDD5118312.1 glycosyltransferase family 9 protein [Sulfuricurvum sp.]
MGLPLHSRIRQKIKNALNALLALLFPSHAKHEIIPTEGIQRILVIRINYRIGNILFTTPLLRALEHRFPDAKIDILIGAKYPAPLLKSSAVQNVFDLPRRLLKNPFHLYRYIQQLRATKYDLVLNLNSGSASDRGAAFLARGTYKLGFDVPGNWTPLTHVVNAPSGSVHEALKPLYLMEAFGNDANDFPQKMDIALSKEEKIQGLEELKKRLSLQGYTWGNKEKIIGIFRDARFEKKIENTWWKEWYLHMKKLNPDAVFVDILSPDVKEKLDDDFYTLMESNLRLLGTILSQMDAFICGDTGPMHLASASGVPTLALFKASAPTLYGTLGTNDRSLTLQGSTPEMIATQITQHLQSLLPASQGLVD